MYGWWRIAVSTLVVLGLFPVHAASADELDTLLADYQSHGLPLPPDSARLVVRKRVTSVDNGVPQYRFELAFLIGRAEKPSKSTYWYGCEPVVLESTYPDVDAALRAEAVSKTESLKPEYSRAAFRTIPDLALAIQCKARGWNELARGLLERSRRPIDGSDRRLVRPRDDRRAVAALAWNYWCNRFFLVDTKEHRGAVVDQLRRLLDKQYGLDTVANRNIVGDMDATLVKRETPPDTLEASLESLLELDVEGQWPGCGYHSFNNYADRNADYRKLRNAGLEAVPLLIKHLDDFRLTRCTERFTDGRYSWHVRIADVVGVLLDGLNPQGFAYDFRMREGRGRSLDQAHVLHWWTETQGSKGLDYLLKNAITEDSRGELHANEGVLHTLGQGYPDELVKLFEQQIEKVDAAYTLCEALADSKASEEQKARLFLLAANSKRSWNRDSALRNLLRMKHPQAVPLLVQELERLPVTPKEPYWQSDSDRFAQLVNYTDDNRAWEAWEKTARRVDIGQRLEMIEGIANCPASRRERVIEMLAKFQNDDQVRQISKFPNFDLGGDPRKILERMQSDLFSGPSAGFMFETLRVGDFAVLQLAELLGLPTDSNSNWKKEDWVRLRERVQAALDKRTVERTGKKEGKP